MEQGSWDSSLSLHRAYASQATFGISPLAPLHHLRASGPTGRTSPAPIFPFGAEIEERPLPDSMGPLQSPGHSPARPLPQDHISCLQVKSVVVAGALSQGHTAAFLIHEGIVRAATAFHRGKSLKAVRVTL